jgi:hypothetical protein
VGRLKGYSTPTLDKWKEEIALAERLLIHAHGPAYNSTNIDAPNEGTNPEIRNIRVLNWGSVRSLNREVSGLMWTTARTQFNQCLIYGKEPAL